MASENTRRSTTTGSIHVDERLLFIAPPVAGPKREDTPSPLFDPALDGRATNELRSVA
jgi:hypothetical protein